MRIIALSSDAPGAEELLDRLQAAVAKHDRVGWKRNRAGGRAPSYVARLVPAGLDPGTVAQAAASVDATVHLQALTALALLATGARSRGGELRRPGAEARLVPTPGTKEQT